ncbi:MAG: dipicolinate synthase subunit B [Clostridia bacterium]|nr:dipicolinate synthase subunit B [Clostridia bacterium]
MVEPVKVGFALTGSFCTFDKVILELKELCREYDVTVIMSKSASSTDTRFGTAKGFMEKAEDLSQRKVITEISTAEPIGPKKLFDALIIAPCTGNTLAKLAHGITDTPVTMAAKAHLRNERPLIIAPSTNDGLGANAKNLGLLLNTKNIYFVPFGQDDPINKHNSLVADFTKIIPTLQEALKGRQIQPILV